MTTSPPDHDALPGNSGNVSPASTPPEPVTKKHVVVFSAVSALLGLADVASKYLMFALLPPLETGRIHGKEVISGFFYLTPRINRGFAWSMLDFLPHQLTAFINIVIIGVVAYFYFFSEGLRRKGWSFWGAVFIMGGALGNLFDRLVYGGVRDFLDFVVPVVQYNYPVFNIADVFVVAGTLMLLLEGFLEERKEKKERG